MRLQQQRQQQRGAPLVLLHVVLLLGMLATAAMKKLALQTCQLRSSLLAAARRLVRNSYLGQAAEMLMPLLLLLEL
jgi:hypothetical protein